MTFHIHELHQKSKRFILEVWEEACEHMDNQDQRIKDLEAMLDSTTKPVSLTVSIDHEYLQTNRVKAEEIQLSLFDNMNNKPLDFDIEVKVKNIRDPITADQILELALKKSGYSKKTVSERYGVSRDNFSRWKKGTAIPFITLQGIVNFCGFTMLEILTELEGTSK